MKAQGTPSINLDEEVKGEPISAGGLTLEPAARLRARIWTLTGYDQGARGQDAAAFVKLTPERVTVRGGAGGEQEVAITNLNAQSLKGIGLGMLAVAGVCLLLIAIGKLIALRGHLQEE